MTDRPDPLPRALRSLPLCILVGTGLSGIVLPFMHWLALVVFRYPPNPPGPVWVKYLTIRVVAGACVGAAVYAAARLSNGWLRWCLLSILMLLLVEGDLPDFARQPLDEFLAIWAGVSVVSGVVLGTLFYLLDRRARARQVTPGTDR